MGIYKKAPFQLFDKVFCQVGDIEFSQSSLDYKARNSFEKIHMNCSRFRTTTTIEKIDHWLNLKLIAKIRQQTKIRLQIIKSG